MILIITRLENDSHNHNHDGLRVGMIRANAQPVPRTTGMVIAKARRLPRTDGMIIARQDYVGNTT